MTSIGSTLAIPSASASTSWDWLAAAKKAKADQRGWCIWNGKVLLPCASSQYKRPVTLKPGDIIPFNETSGWWEEGGFDHWFEIPLDSPKIRHDIGTRVTGRLYTTRMPRGLDLAPGDPWPDAVSEKYRQQGRTEREYFEENVMDYYIHHVWVLVEPDELKKVASECLLDYYRSLGITVHHTPIEDFNAPSFQHEEQNINDINLALMAGENVVVHCMGGTGRTGTVVVGAVRNLGVGNSVKHCRRIKSTYLEVKEQEELFEHTHRVITQQMFDSNPNFTGKLILDHLEDLCREVTVDGFGLLDADKFGAEEKRVLRLLFDAIDMHGQDGIVSVSEFTLFLHRGIAERGLDAGAYSNITNPALKLLFQTIDPSMPDVCFEEDSITFELFLDAMSKNPAISRENKKTEMRVQTTIESSRASNRVMRKTVPLYSKL